MQCVVFCVVNQKIKTNSWTCGCTTVVCSGDVNAKCLKCGNPFIRVIGEGRGNQAEKQRSEEAPVKLMAPVVEVPECERCTGTGSIRAYTQEWDRIKCHQVPCPMCRPREWTDWLANKKILMIK